MKWKCAVLIQLLLLLITGCGKSHESKSWNDWPLDMSITVPVYPEVGGGGALNLGDDSYSPKPVKYELGENNLGTNYWRFYDGVFSFNVLEAGSYSVQYKITLENGEVRVGSISIEGVATPVATTE